MLIVTGQREAAFLLKTVKRMLYLGYVLLPYVSDLQSRSIFSFSLDISTIKCD